MGACVWGGCADHVGPPSPAAPRWSVKGGRRKRREKRWRNVFAKTAEDTGVEERGEVFGQGIS